MSNPPLWIRNKWLYWIYVAHLSAAMGVLVGIQINSGFSWAYTIIAGGAFWAATEAIRMRREFLFWVRN